MAPSKFFYSTVTSSLCAINWTGHKIHRTKLLQYGIALLTTTILATTVFGTGLFLTYNHGSSEQRCKSFLHDGRWSFAYESSNNVQWHPYGSMLQPYDQALTHTCLDNRTTYFIGDSTIRQIFWAIVVKLDDDDASRASNEAGKHEDISYGSKGVSLEFIWDPYLNSSRATSILKAPQTDPPQVAILISTGLWHARYGGETFVSEYRETLERAKGNTLLNNATSAVRSKTRVHSDQVPVILVPPPFLVHDRLNPERASTLTEPRLSHITSQLATVEGQFGLEVTWAAREMTHSHPAAMLEEGLHVTRDIAAHQAELLLNRLCNEHLIGSNTAYSRPCVSEGRVRWSWSILLGSCLVVYESYQQVKLNHSWHRTRATIVVFTVVLFCWIADRTLVFDKSDKLFSEQLFVLVAVGATLLGLVGLKRIPAQITLPHTKDGHIEKSSEILSRAQTEEWKGWMQIVILLYHYWGMSKVLWVYQTVRVLVGSYLFLTGYGHATYFQNTNDFSLKRVVTVLLRINLLPCMLAVVMNNKYDFYYFPGLASLWFLITYAIFWTSKSRRLTPHEILLRTGMSMLTLLVMLQSDCHLSIMFRGMQAVFGPQIDPKEFIFRVKLDVFAPFFGMAFSTVQHRGISSSITWRPSPALQWVLSVMIVPTGHILIISYMLVARQFRNKFASNEYHSLLSLLPISAYIMMRNANSTARRWYAPLFVSVGTFSLELFVLQYHIWLAADTKGLLRLGWIDTPHFAPAERSVAGSWTFWVESAVITIVFFWVSRQCANATNTLVRWFVDTNNNVLLMKTTVILGILWMFNVLAKIDGR